MGAVFLGFPWLMGHEQLLGQDYAAGNQPLQGRKENAWIKTVSERPASLGVLDVRVAFKWESFDTGGTATVWWLHLYAPRSTLHAPFSKTLWPSKQTPVPKVERFWLLDRVQAKWQAVYLWADVNAATFSFKDMHVLYICVSMSAPGPVLYILQGTRYPV